MRGTSSGLHRFCLLADENREVISPLGYTQLVECFTLNLWDAEWQVFDIGLICSYA